VTTHPNQPSTADLRFRALCETGSLENVRILRHPQDPEYLLGINANLFDPDSGYLHLEYRYGYRGNRTVPRTDEDQELGLRAWVGVDGKIAAKLTDEEASVLGYAEFSGITSEASREHVNEAFRQLERIWDHAAIEVRRTQETRAEADIGDTVFRMNRISMGSDPGIVWREAIIRQLTTGTHLGGELGSVAFWSTFPIENLEHYPKISLSCRYSPGGAGDTYGLESSWADPGDGSAVLKLRISGLPGSPEDLVKGWEGLAAIVGEDVAGQLHAAGDWLQALGSEATGYVTGRVRGIGIRMVGDGEPGPGDVGRGVLAVRAEAARRAGVARLGAWADDVLG
jgi:hypothetical protein